jgi:hypothetical protein
MSAPLVPSPLDYIGRRRFAFYPAIKNASPNEWHIGGGSWSEVQVVNAHNNLELWVPRQFIGAVSEPDESLPVVGLRRELEFHHGLVEPRSRGIIEMPVSQAPRFGLGIESEEERKQAGPASVVDIRLSERSDSSLNRAVATLAIGAIVVCLLSALLAAASGIDNTCAHASAACSGHR